MERHPTLEYVTINAPEAADQIVSGIFPERSLDVAGRDRRPEEPRRPEKLRAEFYIPPNAPARQVTPAARRPRSRAAHVSRPGTRTL